MTTAARRHIYTRDMIRQQPPAKSDAAPPVQSTLLDALVHIAAQRPDAAAHAQHWLDRVEVLLGWIGEHPKFVEIRSEAARLLLEYRNTATDAPAEKPVR